MKKWKTLFDFKVYEGRVLQISSTYDKKCALKSVQKISRLNQKSGQSLTQYSENPESFSKNGKHYSILIHLN